MSKQDATRTIMVRMDRADHARLTAYRDRLAEWALTFPDKAPPYLLEIPLSLSAALRFLLAGRDNHRMRRKASRAGKRAGSRVQSG